MPEVALSLNPHPANNNKRHMHYPNRPSQLGVGLIEVLIAVLVLSIGILGLAALQTRALSDNGGSLNRSAAIAATYSIIEGMRLDRANAITAKYNTTVTTNACPAAGTTLANYLLNNWCVNQLGGFLGKVSSAKGIIYCDPAGACKVTIQIDDTKTTGGSSAFQLVTKATI